MKNNKNKILNVLYSSNDTFSPYLAVSLYSLLKNNSSDFKEIRTYIFDDNISQKNRNYLINIGKIFNQPLNFIEGFDIEKQIGKKIHLMKKEGLYSLTPYFRLFTSTHLPEIDKIIYLDADSLVVGSLKELWDTNINNYYVAGVLDTLGVEFTKKEIGLSNQDNYINSGVLLINLKKWREDEIESKFIDFLINHLERFIYHDQGIINGVCKEKMFIIHPKYNFQGQFHGIDYNKAIKWAGFENYYDEETVKNAQENPIFIHFTGNFNRPWSNKNQYYHKLYYEYINEMPYNEELIFRELPSKITLFFYKVYISKITTYLLKLLPMKIAIKLANLRIKTAHNQETKKLKESER